MKKIIALILTFLFLTVNSSFAFSELYNLYGVSEQKVSSIVKNNLENLNYRFESENPYYVISNKNPKRYAVIIVQQNGNNVFYYFYTGDKGDTELNNGLLRTFRSFRISYEKQSYNSNIMNVYDNIAQRTMSSPGSLNQYNFDEYNQTSYSSGYSNPISQPVASQQQQYYNQNTTVLPAYPPSNTTSYNNGYNTNTQYNNTSNQYNTNTQYNSNTQYSSGTNGQSQIFYANNNGQNSYLTPGTAIKSQQATVLKGSVVSLESGTKFKTYLQNPINTSSANKGDRVIAVLTDDLKYNGVVVAPQGSLVYGTLTKARHATYGSRNGRVIIQFTQLVTPENKTYEISTEKIDFTVTNDGKLSRTVGNAVAGAAVGALAGLIFGAMGDYSLLAASAIGAGVGAGTSLIGSGAERGVDAEIPSFTELELELTRPLKVTVNY